MADINDFISIVSKNNVRFPTDNFFFNSLTLNKFNKTKLFVKLF